MNNFILLFCGLSLFNVIIQTTKSLCTVKCSTFISACVNALAYGVYVYVIVFTNSDGLPLWSKALITAAANFIGVYLANALFNKLFTHEVKWKIEVSIPNAHIHKVLRKLCQAKIDWYECGHFEQWTCLAIFAPTSKVSAQVKKMLPKDAKYNIVECTKRL